VSRFTDKVAAVTGAAGGIGAATAARLAPNLKLIPLFDSVNYYGLGPKGGGVGRR